MKKLPRILLIAALTVGAGLSVGAFAHSRDGRDACMGGHFVSSQPGAQMAKRQAELHAMLALKEDQEAAWKSFVEKIRPGEMSLPDRKVMGQLSAPERMEKMLSLMKERETRMNEHLAALKAFYSVLTPIQQKIFDENFPRRGAAARVM